MEPASELTGYHRFVAQGRLQIRRCRATGLSVEYGDFYCKCCDANDFVLADAGTHAELMAIAWYHRQYASEHPAPYNVAVARLTNGPEVLGTLLGVDPAQHPVGRQVVMATRPDGRLVFTLKRASHTNSPSTT